MNKVPAPTCVSEDQSASTVGKSALGQKQTCAAQKVMSAVTPKADMCGAPAHVRKVPIADIKESYQRHAEVYLGGADEAAK